MSEACVFEWCESSHLAFHQFQWVALTFQQRTLDISFCVLVDTVGDSLCHCTCMHAFMSVGCVVCTVHDTNSCRLCLSQYNNVLFLNIPPAQCPSIYCTHSNMYVHVCECVYIHCTSAVFVYFLFCYIHVHVHVDLYHNNRMHSIYCMHVYTCTCVLHVCVC